MNQKDDLLAQGLTKQLSTMKSGSSLSPGKSPTKRGQVKLTYGSVKNYIMEDPKNRQFYDIQRMQQYFRTLPYFDKICSKLDTTRQTSVLEKFCKKLRYMTLMKGEFLFKQNEKSEYFFILLEGKASVLIPKREEIIENEKQLIPNKLTKNLQKQINQFYENPHGNRLKVVKSKTVIPSLNRMSFTNLLKEDNLPIIKLTSQKSPLSNDSPQNSEQQNLTLLNLQNISPVQQRSAHPSPFKLKYIAEQAASDQNSQMPSSSNLSKGNQSRSSLIVITKNPEIESVKSMNNVDGLNSIIPRTVKQQFSKEYQQILDDQAKQFDLAVDGFVFKYTFGKILESGEAIGGVDILNNKSRRETVFCIDDCEFAMITKAEYIEILKEIEESKFNKKLNRLIHSLDPEIPHLRRLMGRMVSFLKKQQYKRGQVIYNQNEEVKGCYLITQGEIQIVKELKMIPPENHLEKYAHRQIQPNKQLHSLACVSVGQYIGEEELLCNSNLRGSSAICSSYECKVYFIEKQHFIKLISDQLDIKLAFEKAILQKEKFNSQKFSNLSKIIQSNYNQKFQIRDTSSRQHLLKYKDDKNQFRDCFQKINYLEIEAQKKKEIPSSQERIGGIAKEKILKGSLSNEQRQKIIIKKKSMSEHKKKDKQLNTLNITLKIKEHQNNTSEALTDHFIKVQNQLQQQQANRMPIQRSISLNFPTQPDEEQEHKNDEAQQGIFESKPRLDMIEYLLKGNKHAKCQVSQHLKKLQKKDSNKEKMSKTLGSTFFIGVYSKITEDFNHKKIQEDQNQIFQSTSQDLNSTKSKNIHLQQSFNQSRQLNQQNINSSQNNNSIDHQNEKQEKLTFCGPISKPYVPEMEEWRKSAIKKINSTNQIQNTINNSISHQNLDTTGLTQNQNKQNKILLNLTHNRNHGLHLIKSHKCFQQSHLAVKQLIKKTNQIQTLGDYQKQFTEKTQPTQETQTENNLDQFQILSSRKHAHIFEEVIPSQLNGRQDGQLQRSGNQQQTSNIENYIKQLDEITSYHVNQVFKPKQRALSGNKRCASSRTRTSNTDRETNHQNNSTLNGSNNKFSRNDLSFDTHNSKSMSVIVVNHMGQPRKYIY